MRTLTGQVEQLTYQVQQLQDQLERAHEDADQAGKGAAKRLPAPAASAAPVGKAPAGRRRACRADGAAPAGPAAPPPCLSVRCRRCAARRLRRRSSRSTLRPFAAAAMPAPGHRRRGRSAPATRSAGLRPCCRPWRSRVRLRVSPIPCILAGDYDLAEAGFRAFLAAHPDDEHAADAQYWLGESLFARGKYRDAANEFLNGYKTYPKSGKAPGHAAQARPVACRLGERDAACSTYAQVLKQYPQTSNALRQRVITEQASAGC